MKVLFLSVPYLPDSSGFFIAPDTGRNHEDVLPDYRLYSLAAVVKRNRFSVEILDLTFNDFFHMEEALPSVSEDELGAIYITADTSRWPAAKRIIEMIRVVFPTLPIILGGMHATVLDEYVLNSTTANYVVRGESERSLVRLLQYLNGKKERIEDITGITYKRKGEVFRNSDTKLLDDKDFEQLPFPLLERMPTGAYDAVPLETSRGYPFASPFHCLPHEKEWRSLSPMGIYEHLYWARENIVHATRKKYYYLIDDYFTAKEKRIFDFYEICQRKDAVFPLEYTTRCSDLLEESLVETLVPYTRKLKVNIHTGYDKGLATLQAGFDTRIILDVAGILRKHSLAKVTQLNFTVGFPWETPEEAGKTVEFARHLYLEYGISSRINDFRLIPGSCYWSTLFSGGKIEPAWYDSFSSRGNEELQKLAAPLFSLDDRKTLQVMIEKVIEEAEMETGNATKPPDNDDNGELNTEDSSTPEKKNSDFPSNRPG